MCDPRPFTCCLIQFSQQCVDISITLIYFHIADEKSWNRTWRGDSLKVNEVTLSSTLHLPASKPLLCATSPTFLVISATNRELQPTNQLFNDGKSILVFLERWKAMLFMWRTEWEKCSTNRVTEGMDSKMQWRQSAQTAATFGWGRTSTVMSELLVKNNSNQTSPQSHQQKQADVWAKTGEQCTYPLIRECNWVKHLF